MSEDYLAQGIFHDRSGAGTRREYLRRCLLVLAIVWCGLVAWSIANAATPFTVTINSSYEHRYFSPNGDGQEDQAFVPYCINDGANVDIAVHDATGRTVRTIESGVSHRGDAGCSYFTYFEWNGKDDSGVTVPDGVYDVRVHAVNAAGETADATSELGVDTRIPGALTSPAPQETVSGTVTWRFAATPGVNVTSVSVYCDGAGFANAGSGPGGVFTGSADTAACRSGANSITASVSWTDSFGQYHSWGSPGVPVTIDNPPRVSIPPYNAHRYFSPNADNFEDTAVVYYCLDKPATVTAVVTDSAGTTLRTSALPGQNSFPSCSVYNVFSWDGKDGAGHLVPDGVYTVHVHAVDTSGQTGDDTVQVGVDTRTPGTLVAPAPGTTLTGTVNWTFRATAGFPVSSVDAYCEGTGLGQTTAGNNGEFSGSGDTASCSPGENVIIARASWTDPFGASHVWAAPAVPVVVNNPPRITIDQYSAHRYFSPDGDEQEDQESLYFCLTKPSSLEATVSDAAGLTVRTLTASGTSGGTYCEVWNNAITWDGKDDAGRVVADGVYTVRIRATDTAGQTGEDSVQVGIDTRKPGALTAPAPGSTLSRAVGWTFRPTPGFPVTDAYVSCRWSPSTRGTAGDDGAFTGSLDTTGCNSGPNELIASAYWADPFGRSHAWSSPSVPVTISNAPRIDIYQYAHRYFSPNGDSQEDDANIYYCLSTNATVTASVTDAAGAVVRTFAPADSIGGNCYGSTNNWLSWDGKNDAGQVVADGVYTVHLHATGSGGLIGDSTLDVGVDSRSPGRLTAPAAGDTLAGLAPLAFRPTEGYSISSVGLYFDNGGSATIFNASADGTWRTTIAAGTMPSGPTTLHTSVGFTDPFGATHGWTAPDTPVVIDPSTLPLTVSADPATGPAPLADTLRIITSDPQSRTVHYTVNFGDGSPAATGDVVAPYPALTVPHTYAAPGVYRAVVSVTNSAGGSSTQSVDITATGAANTAPQAGLTLDTSSGIAPLPVTATLAGTDAQNDPLTYRLDFGDGQPFATGTLPRDPVQHTYQRAGVYLVRLEVSDGRLTRVKTATVTVGLAEPLAANAGDDQVATAGSTIHFDGSAARPAAGIESYRWDFGDGTSANGMIVDHTYTTAGRYTATLTVTANGQSKQDTATIDVKPAPAETGLIVTVTDTDQHPVPGADVIVIDGSGVKYSATTDQAGAGHLHGLPDGTYAVYGWKAGFLPVSGSGTVTGDQGSATLALRPGEVATAALTWAPMTRDEIVAAGINPDDPANQNTYQFSVNVAVDPGTTTTVSGFTASGGFPLCPVVTGTTVTCTDNYASFTSHDHEVTVTTTYVHNQPQLVWLVMPVKASWLKEFFTVQMMVTNLADPPFTLDHGTADLPLPTGLTLAPTATPQQQTVTLPDIDGGKSATATWLVRGDIEGNYDLAASYTGSLEPFGDTVNIQALTQKPLHVWGGSAMTMTVDVDNTATEHVPYQVNVSLHNIADVPVYNPAIEALPDGTANVIFQPRQRLRQATDVIQPGATFTVSYTLVPTVSGHIDVATTFIKKSAGNQDITSTVTTHPSSPRATLTVDTSLRNQVKLQWQPIPGAADYQIFATPSPTKPFTEIPVATTSTTEQMVSQEAGTKLWYAVSATVRGEAVMLHPLTGATATLGQSPKLQVMNEDGSLADAVIDVEKQQRTIKVRATDVDGQLPTLVMNLPSKQAQDNHIRCTPVTPAPLTAGLDCVLAQSHPGDWYEIDPQFTADDGDEHHATTTTVRVGTEYTALGDSYSSGEGALPSLTDFGKIGPNRPWFQDPDGTSTDTEYDFCHRSTQAYPYLIAGQPGVPANLRFHACSGAKIENIMSIPQTGEPSRQLGHLNDHSTAVTMSVGGNDVGFADVIKSCLLPSLPRLVSLNPCERAHATEVAQAIDHLAGQLKDTYQAVLDRAPNADVYVMGYPRFFAPQSLLSCPLAGNRLPVGFNPLDEDWVNSQIAALNAKIRSEIAKVASSDLARIRYVDVYDSLQGHEACRYPTAWLNDAVLWVGDLAVDPLHLDFTMKPWLGDHEYSFHPNSDGHKQLAERMKAAIGGYTAAKPTIHLGETLLQTITIGPDAALNAVIRWPGSDVVTSLVSPSGRMIDRATVSDDVTHEVTPTTERYSVAHPEAGEWKIRSFGADIAPGGEKLAVSVTTQPGVLPPPTVQASSDSITVAAGKPVAYTATASPGVGFLWDFGDGQVSTEAAPVHTYTSAGTFEPMVSVVDSRGGRAVATLPPITVTAPPSPVATDQTLGATVDVPLPVHLSGVVAGNSPLAFQITAQPEHGTLTGTGADVVYHPAPGSSAPTTSPSPPRRTGKRHPRQRSPSTSSPPTARQQRP